MNEINKIFVIRLSSIGDIILSTPLLRSLRNAFPDAQIDFMVKKEFSEILKYNPHITNLIEFDKSKGLGELRKLKKIIRKEKYDLLIDVHRNLRSYYLKFNSGALYKSSYSKQLIKRALLVKTHLNFYKNVKPVFLRYFESVKGLGISYDGKGTDLFFPEEISLKIKETLTTGNLLPGQKLVVICPGASFSNKRWLPESFAEAADFLAEMQNAYIVFAGGKSDVELCSTIQSLMKNKSVSFAGKLSLLQSSALLKEASLVITNDSGLMHIAQAVKKPVIAIFGPTTKELGFFPLPENSIVIEKEIKCRPCTSKGLNKCPEKHFKCMRETPALEVAQAAEKILAGDREKGKVEREK